MKSQFYIFIASILASIILSLYFFVSYKEEQEPIILENYKKEIIRIFSYNCSFSFINQTVYNFTKIFEKYFNLTVCYVLCFPPFSFKYNNTKCYIAYTCEADKIIKININGFHLRALPLKNWSCFYTEKDEFEDFFCI